MEGRPDQEHEADEEDDHVVQPPPVHIEHQQVQQAAHQRQSADARNPSQLRPSSAEDPSWPGMRVSDEGAGMQDLPSGGREGGFGGEERV